MLVVAWELLNCFCKQTTSIVSMHVYGKWLGLLPFCIELFLLHASIYALKICILYCIFTPTDWMGEWACYFYSCSESFAYKFHILTKIQMHTPKTHTHTHACIQKQIYILSLSNNQTVVMYEHAEPTSKFSASNLISASNSIIWFPSHTKCTHRRYTHMYTV